MFLAVLGGAGALIETYSTSADGSMQFHLTTRNSEATQHLKQIHTRIIPPEMRILRRRRFYQVIIGRWVMVLENEHKIQVF